ncbi:hypothetical protein CkaCkLH20_08205 [Colletotrichum karsti]|uniref:Nephrocystin 3-like N-terminal domain-containing protein n=1 Tax=Colletotrichum karsti TaxID=1095194 RepID=A0A9P6I1T5_9PEZI|nr:uncharacterized protein CkaCkLH20_08205 [Colletotrichum karsti]KAF9874222.1 hypothetical protein CkaCkLH20_08205 [Colletotrichum karsti]
MSGVLRGVNPESDFEVIQHEDTRLLPDDLLRLQSWLEPTDYSAESSELNRHLLSRAPKTGLWLAETPRYKQWLTSPDHGSLWIKGVPGAGKSVLAASAVQDFLHPDDNDPLDEDSNGKGNGTPVLFFFFRHIIQANRFSGCLVRDWLAQLLPYSLRLQGSLQALSKEKKLQNVSEEELWEHLLGGLATLAKAYCIIDALDEMDTKDVATFFPRLNKLAAFRPDAVKILMTSRPRQDLQMHLTATSIVHISLEEDKVGQEIEVFVRHRLKQITPGAPETHVTLAKAISKRSKGLFLYARLLLDQILPGLEAGAKVDIDAMPIHLEHMYNEILAKRVHELGIPQEVQAALLACVTHSPRPVRLRELAGLLVFRFNIVPEATAKAIARQACHPLLEILEDETVQVIHHSLSEFLFDKTRRAVDPGVFPPFDHKEVHRDLAKTCMKLNIQVLEEKEHQAAAKYPFFNYSRDNWFHHVTYDKHVDDADFLEALERLWKLHFDATICEGRYSKRWPKHLTGEKCIGEHESPVHLAVKIELHHLAHKCLPEWTPELTKTDESKHPWSKKANVQASRFEYLIQGVCKKNNVDLLKAVWPALDGMRWSSESGLSSLVWAAIRSDSYDTLTALIDLGVDLETNLKAKSHLNVVSSDSYIPRKVTIYDLRRNNYGNNGNFSTQTLGLILPYVDTVMRHGLFLGCAHAGRLDLLKVFVDPERWLSAELVVYKQALRLICANEDKTAEHLECLRLLFESYPEGSRALVQSKLHAEDDPKSDGRTESTMHALVRGWCEENHEISAEIFELLLEHGAELEARDNYGDTPIFLFFDKRGLNVRRPLKRFLEAGADASVLGKDGESVLIRAVMNKFDLQVCELLLDYGADVHAVKLRAEAGEGKPTPALACCWMKRPSRPYSQTPPDPSTAEEVAKFLISRGATIEDGGYPADVINNALKRFRPGEHTLLEMLLATANPTTNFDECLFTIHQEFGSGFVAKYDEEDNQRCVLPFIKALVNAGANIETRRQGDGATPFLETSTYPAYLTASFAAAGADTKAKDEYGRSLLHRVVANNNPTRYISNHFVNYLCSLAERYGMSPLDRDAEGNTLLHLAVTIGGSYTADDKYARDGASPFFEQLLNWGISPLFRNSAGQTPLHLLFDDNKPWSCVSKTENVYKRADNIISLLGKADEGSGINERDGDGLTPLHYACMSTRGSDPGRGTSPGFLKVLLAHGADLRARDVHGRDALHLACVSRNTASVGYLVDQDHALLDEVDGNGRTPLFTACVSGVAESVGILLRAGARLNATDNEGWSPFHACAEIDQEEARWVQSREEQKRFPERGIDRYRPYVPARPEEKDRYPRSCYEDREDPHCFNTMNARVMVNQDMAVAGVVGAMLRSGADPKIKGGPQNQTVLERAQAVECSSVVAALRRLGPETCGDGENSTASGVQKTFEITDAVLRDPWSVVSHLKLEDIERMVKLEANLVSCMEVIKDEKTSSLQCRQGMSFMERLVANGVTEAVALMRDLTRHGEDASTLVDPWTMKALQESTVQGRTHVSCEPGSGYMSYCCRLDEVVRDFPLQEIRTLEDLYTIIPFRYDSILHISCLSRSPNMEMVRTLVERCNVRANLPTRLYKRADIKTRFHERKTTIQASIQTILHAMAKDQQYWHLEAIAYLASIRDRAGGKLDFNSRNQNGDTPLHVVVKNPGPFTDKFIELFLRLGVDPHIQTSNENSDYTGRRKCFQMVSGKLLAVFVACGVDVGDHIDLELFMAIARLRKEDVELALDAGANINVSEPGALGYVENVIYEPDVMSDDESMVVTPMYAAMSYDTLFLRDHPREDEWREEIIRLLIDRGVDLYAVNDVSVEPSSSKIESVPFLHRQFEIVRHSQRFSEIFFDYTVFEGKGNVDFNKRDASGRTVFLAACNAGIRSKSHHKCHKKGALDDYRDALEDEAREGAFGCVEDDLDEQRTGLFLRMLEYGADITAVDEDGKTALHTLLANPDMHEQHIMKFLALPESHAMVNVQDKRGFTTLQHALRILRPNIINRLLELGATGLTEADPDEMTALHRIASKCISIFASEPYEDVLNATARGERYYCEGSRSTHPAMYNRGHIESCKVLWDRCVDLGMDVNQPDAYGNPPLFYFVAQNDGVMGQFSELPCRYETDLYDHRPSHIKHFEKFFGGADLSARNSRGETILHVLATKRSLAGQPCPENIYDWRRNDARLFDFFVFEKGVDRFTEDVNGQTCLDVAAAEKREEILELFKRKN